MKVREGWLSPLVDYLDSHPDCCAVQPKILSLTSPDHFEMAGAAGGFLDYLGYPYYRGCLLHHIETDTGQYDTVADVTFTSGACMLVRSDAFKKAGGFDGDFFMHQEEIDLCLRLWESGYRCVCVPQSVVHHLGGGSLSRSDPRKTFLNFRNNYLLLFKNMPERGFWKILLRFSLDFAAAGFLTFKHGPRSGIQVMLGMLAALGLAGRMLSKRKNPSGFPFPVSKAPIIPWKVFFLGIRKFGELKGYGV